MAKYFLLLLAILQTLYMGMTQETSSSVDVTEATTTIRSEAPTRLSTLDGSTSTHPPLNHQVSTSTGIISSEIPPLPTETATSSSNTGLPQTKPEPTQTSQTTSKTGPTSSTHPSIHPTEHKNSAILASSSSVIVAVLVLSALAL